jgi:DNA-directed RNA polymerase specialized sigma subunit
MKKKRSSSNSNNYFNSNVEQAVVNYITSQDQNERDRIYREVLSPVFKRMALGIMTRYKLFPKKMTQDQFMKESISHLVEQMRRFDESVGSKAYSYFGTIIKNHMLLICRKEAKSRKSDANYDDIAYEIMNDEKYTYLIDETEEDKYNADNIFQKGKIEDLLQFIIPEIEFPFHLADLNKNDLTNILPAIRFVLENYDKVNWGENTREQKRAVIDAMSERANSTPNEVKKTLKKILDIYKLFRHEYK